MTPYMPAILSRASAATLLGMLFLCLINERLSAADQSIESLAKPLSIGSPLDGFQLTDHLGKEWTLEEFRSKKAIVFAFVGTQCPLAKLYSEKIVSLEKKYRDRGVAFIAVDSNVQDSLAEMSAHARKFGIDFAFLKDPSQTLADRLGITRTPEVCVIDADSRIRYRGRIDDQYGIGYTRDHASATELVVVLAILTENRSNQPLLMLSISVTSCMRAV
jgi:peroxiredoxin